MGSIIKRTLSGLPVEVTCMIIQVCKYRRLGIETIKVTTPDLVWCFDNHFCERHSEGGKMFIPGPWCKFPKIFISEYYDVSKFSKKKICFTGYVNLFLGLNVKKKRKEEE